MRTNRAGQRAAALLRHRGCYRWQTAWLWFFCLLLCLVFGPSRAQEPIPQSDTKFVQRSDDDLLLLSVYLDSLVLTQELEAYQHPGGVLLPLGEMCRVLELAVTVSPSTGTADGFVAQVDRHFHIDMGTHKVTLAGKEAPFDPALVELHRNDIYVDSKLLGVWLTVGLDVDRNASSVRVLPREPLPLQKRLERERRAAQSRHSLPYRDPGFPRASNRYGMFGGPAIDQTLSMNLNPTNGSGGMALRYTAQVAADIAHVGVNAFVDVEPGNAPIASRFSVGQMDATGRLLGALHAREVTVGQIYAPAIPLVSDTHPASGLVISNYPLYHSSQFDANTFAGNLPPGWDVELYRDEALLEYQQASPTGRYEFKNVPLIFGNNNYRLVFYGPHGERREERRSFNVGDSLIPRGENWYRVWLAPGLNGDSQYTWQDEFGLRRNLSGALGLTTARLSDGIHQYGSVGVRGYTGGLFAYTNVVADPQTGLAQELGLHWQWRGTAVEVKHTYVNGLVSETLSPDVNPIREQTILRLGNIPSPRWTRLLPMDVEAVREETREGTLRWELRDRLSYQTFGLGVTNLLYWKSEQGQPALGQGELLINRWGHSLMLQSQISYTWAPTLQPEQFSLQTQTVLRDLRLLTLGIYHSVSDRNYGLTAALTRSVGPYSYSLSADLSNKKGLSLGFNISLGLLREPRKGRWDSEAQSQASRGAVLVQAYLDTNGNGRQDPGEPPVPGVGFFVNDVSYPKVTGKDGTVLLEGLTQFQPADLRISEGSLSDPLWIPKRTGIRIVPRPGNVPILDFPIVSTGEISGTVYLKDNTGVREAGGIALELVGVDGRIVQKQTTAYDGFYTFSRVPVGTFRVRLAPPPASQTGLSAVEVPLRIPPEGAFLDGANLTIVDTTPAARP